ncbi:MAG: peptidylprolyl isomerase [Acidiferrobacterales bacterium]
MPTIANNTPFYAGLLAAGLLAAGALTSPAHAQMTFFPGALRVEPIDRMLVIVNDDVITSTELNARIANVRRELASRRIKPPPRDVLRKQVLDRMVLERIQLQVATQIGVRISDKQIDQTIAQVAKQNGVSPETIYRAMQREGVEIESYRGHIREQLTIQRLVEREINNRITVSDSEVDNYLTSRRGQGKNDAYNLSLILIGIPEAATPEQRQLAKRKADEIRRKLMEGDSFEQAAIAYSQGQNALKGGQLGWKKSGQLPGVFLQALENMQPGDISEAIPSPVGYHILKLNERRTGAPAEQITETHVRHIVIKPSEIRSRAEIQEKLSQLRERVVNGDDFADLARAHSDDTASAAKGGDLGWLRTGETVPEFEKQMGKLAPNEISEPIETPFGFHLIQVIARRQQDISGERERAAARQQIHARKADERYEQWLRQVRDEAYVQYQVGDT